MIKIENVSTVGWEPAIRGARNPMNSWDKSDTLFFHDSRRGCLTNILNDLIFEENEFGLYVYARPIRDSKEKDETFKHWSFMMDVDTMQLDLNAFGFENFYEGGMKIGPNDLKLLANLAKAGSDEAKFRRMIVVYLDVTAPMYWWKEADTYKVGTVRNSCSTMHKIHAKEFTLDDFSHEHLTDSAKDEMQNIIDMLNESREWYLKYDFMRDIDKKLFDSAIKSKKDLWWQMIQLLPSSYNQRATLMLNYEVLANMYHARKNHKLDEWREFCEWIETLPYAKELIICPTINDMPISPLLDPARASGGDR